MPDTVTQASIPQSLFVTKQREAKRQQSSVKKQKSFKKGEKQHKEEKRMEASMEQ